jgi:uncharacterized protein (TIGR01244 family)
MSLPLQPLSNDLCVAPQLDPTAMEAAAAAGFRSVINNRPDFEHGPDQPTSAAIQTAAEAAGLVYVHQPVSGMMQTPEQIAEFRRLLDTLPRPILAFCRSGARCTKLFTAASQLD